LAVAVVLALAFLSSIPEGPHSLVPQPFCLSIPQESAVVLALALALAFLSVIPAGNLLLRSRTNPGAMYPHHHTSRGDPNPGCPTLFAPSANRVGYREATALLHTTPNSSS
jgi:hypothetical protein